MSPTQACYMCQERIRANSVNKLNNHAGFQILRGDNQYRLINGHSIRHWAKTEEVAVGALNGRIGRRTHKGPQTTSRPSPNFLAR
jgi:hypothetical protein